MFKLMDKKIIAIICRKKFALLDLCFLMDRIGIFIWFDSVAYIEGPQDHFQITFDFFTFPFVYVLANSVEPVEMLHYAASRHDLHCLSMYPLTSFQIINFKNEP